jgi:hypothetical protein
VEIPVTVGVSYFSISLFGCQSTSVCTFNVIAPEALSTAQHHTLDQPNNSHLLLTEEINLVANGGFVISYKSI